MIYNGPRKLRQHALAIAGLGALLCTPAAGFEPPTKNAVFITLGTGGGPVVRVKRSQPANAVVVGDAIYLFDLGDGVMRQMAAANLMLHNVKAMFISHHHMDHNADLGPLLVSRWLFRAPGVVPVIGPPGTVAMTEGLAKANDATALASGTLGDRPDIGIAATAKPQDLALAMDVPTLVYQDENVRVLAIINDHYHQRTGSVVGDTARSYSYRIEAGGRSFVFTGDTGPSKNLERLAKGADVLVTEAVDTKASRVMLEKTSGLPPQAIESVMSHMVEDHLTPDDIGKLAAAADVKEVVVTHLAPGMDIEPDANAYADGIETYFKGRIRVANDLDRF